jgi:hypothetical protein
LSKDLSMSCRSLLCVSVPVQKSTRLIMKLPKLGNLCNLPFYLWSSPQADSARKDKIYSEINRAEYVRSKSSIVDSTQSSPTFWMRNYESQKPNKCIVFQVTVQFHTKNWQTSKVVALPYRSNRILPATLCLWSSSSQPGNSTMQWNRLILSHDVTKSSGLKISGSNGRIRVL